MKAHVRLITLYRESTRTFMKNVLLICASLLFIEATAPGETPRLKSVDLIGRSTTDSLKKRKVGSPLANLPKNIRVLTGFGERADFSPDNKRIAFMTKSFGDAMVLDLATNQVKCLTCNVPAAVFLRVMHLSSGDYISMSFS